MGALAGTHHASNCRMLRCFAIFSNGGNGHDSIQRRVQHHNNTPHTVFLIGSDRHNRRENESCNNQQKHQHQHQQRVLLLHQQPRKIPLTMVSALRIWFALLRLGVGGLR